MTELASKEYEFDIAQNEVIGGVSSSMGFVGLVLAIFGGLQAAVGCYHFPSVGAAIVILAGLGTVAVGAWTWVASRSLRDIVTTDGVDISLLMRALAKLRSAYFIQTMMFVIGILTMAASLLAPLAR